MNINTTSLSRFSEEKSLRNDFIYQRLLTTRNKNNGTYYKFSDLFNVLEEKVNYDELNGEFKYCQIGDVTKDGIPQPVFLDFNSPNLLDEDYYKKIKKRDIMRVEKNDILISFLLPQDPNILGKLTRINDDNSDVYFSTAFLRLQPKLHAELLYYCLRSLFYKDIVATARIRKGYTGYATLSKDDLLDLRFDKAVINTLFSIADSITPRIAAIEQQISSINYRIISNQDIIDSILQQKFSFDYCTFNRLKEQKLYFSKLDMFANNPDLRFSAKFHRPTGDFVMHELIGISNKRIKHFLAEPIILGASVSPKNYDENGEYSYISMATIKNWFFDANSASTVSDSYAASKISKSVQKDDIILARSGEGTIGKVAIITDDKTQGIFADFTMRIRLKGYNPTFAYYYFRTAYFQYLVEVYKKGLGNNTNIFPSIIQEFPIPDLSFKEQQSIVDKIQVEISKQNNVINQISRLRSQIDNIILDALKNSG